jgi:hypothetical protein
VELEGEAIDMTLMCLQLVEERMAKGEYDYMKPGLIAAVWQFPQEPCKQ